MTANYIRISTVNQNIDRQLKNSGTNFIDRCSGSTAFTERSGAKKLIKEIEKGNITEVRTDSIDRLGRNTKDILTTLEYFTNHKVQVVAKKEALTLLDEHGKVRPTTKLMLGIMGSLAEFERERIRERTLEGVRIAQLKGKYNGRKTGAKQKPEDALKKHSDIVRELKSGESIRRIAKLTGKAPATVQRVKKFLALQTD